MLKTAVRLQATNGTKRSLDDRIADAFNQTFSSAQLADILADIDFADKAAQVARQNANEIALDPLTRPDAVISARKDMEDADFRRLRLENAKAKLSELLEGAKRRERENAMETERRAAIAERDQLVADLAEYEALAAKMTGLLTRLAANNYRLSQLPEWVARAEPIARGAEQEILVRIDQTLPRLLEGVRLPKFKRDGTNRGFLWPSA